MNLRHFAPCIAVMLAVLAVPAPAAKKAKQVVPPRQRVCTQVTSSGLGYKVLRAGKGGMIGDGQVGVVDYVGYFAKTGEIFDENPAAAFAPDEVVEGFGEGLRMMRTGAIYRLCIPWKLGYGADAMGPIPSRSDLVFQVELRAAMTRTEYRDMLKAARAAKKVEK